MVDPPARASPHKHRHLPTLLLASRLETFMKEGLEIAGRKYEFLAYSSR